MSNLSIPKDNYTTQISLPLGVKEEKVTTRKSYPPSFQPYNNKQNQIVFDIQELIPENHVACVIDEMIESIPDERLFSYYSGGGDLSLHFL
ncbi:transposase [Aneurinibacillus aneurinilyticus]|uniref:Transposase n=1 Tax=Aneurinibacillus aneurinilyticus TaxID=1391 RepID=A0A848CYL1_ANEAE|nr:transposase [Aneurinibacillus aneurinilyticus]NME98340.1 transposase [Aneurinibacillus aneurinilyticus]